MRLASSDGRSGLGYLSAASGAILNLLPNVEENIAMARFANLLVQYTGDGSHWALGAPAMRYQAPGGLDALGARLGGAASPVRASPR